MGQITYYIYDLICWNIPYVNFLSGILIKNNRISSPPIRYRIYETHVIFFNDVQKARTRSSGIDMTFSRMKISFFLPFDRV